MIFDKQTFRFISQGFVSLLEWMIAVKNPQSFLFRSGILLVKKRQTFSLALLPVTCHTPRTKMGFGDVKTAAGVKALNEFLADKAYVEGFVPSQVDVAVFEAMGGKAPSADMAHALR